MQIAKEMQISGDMQPILAAVIETSLECVVLVDEWGLVIAFNPAAERAFGHSRAEAIGRPIAELIIPHHLRAAHEAGFARYLTGGEPRVLGRTIEIEGLHKDGHVFPVELTLTEVKAEGRRVFTASIRDLTQAKARQKELELARDRLELAIRGAKLGTWRAEPATGSGWFSERSRELFGVLPDEEPDQPTIKSYIHPDDWPAVMAPRARGGERYEIEYRVLRRDGTTRWVQSIGSVERDAHGAAAAINGVHIDITERKLGEIALQETRNRLQLAMDAAKLGAWRFDPATGTGWYSDLSRAIWGLEPHEVIDQPTCKKYVHPDDWAAFSGFDRRGWTEDRLDIEFRIIRHDGSLRWVHSTGAVERDENGAPVTINGVASDITERKAAEAALLDAQKRLELAIDAAKLGTFTWDLDTQTGEYSARSQQMVGIAPDVPMNADTVRGFVHPDDWIKATGAYGNRFADGDTTETEWRAVWPDGTVRWLYSIGEVVRDEAGVARNVNGVHLDITERKRAEEELLRSRDALHQSEKLAALGSLLAGVSHELNNPLSAIIGQAQMLEEDSLGTPLEVRAKKISAAAERCSKIVQTFLAMARRREPRRASVDVNALVEAALQLTEYTLRTAGIAVRHELAPGMPAISADSDQLHQVLLNLIINAQQSMEASGLERPLLTVRTGWDADHVFIDIADTGPGIRADVANRIFEPFFTTKAAGSGTGVGLSFSQGIAEAHGGALTLEPSDQGACFRITLPIGIAAPPEAPAPPPELGAAREAVLVVDDEADVAETLCELLERQGYAVERAEDGASAMRALQGRSFDLIFSDLRMPGVSGASFYKQLREERPELADRLAFITGDTLGASMTAFLQDAERPVLEKPFTRDAIRALIAKVRAP